MAQSSMTFGSIVILAVGLAMDAAAVSAARGLATPRILPRHVLLVAVFFGGFQALMPLLGWFVGTGLGPLVRAWDHWFAFVLLCVELALQAYYRVTAGDFLFRRATVPVWAPNEYSGVFNRPHLAFRQGTTEFEASYYTDANGLRVPRPDASFAFEPDADAWRALLLGPSFAFGWGVDYEATFAARLERLYGVWVDPDL